MIKIIFDTNNFLPVIASIGVGISFDPKYARLADGEMADASGFVDFFINESGEKFLDQHIPTWQPLACVFDDELINDNGSWRIKVDADYDIEIIADAERRTDNILDLFYTKSVSRNARYLKKYDAAVKYKDAGYPTPLPAANEAYLKAESSKKGVTEEALAGSIIARSDVFNTAGDKAEGLRAQLSIDVIAANNLADKITASNDFVAAIKLLVA